MRTLEIVGAGPAGLAAAIHAARLGMRVVVHERQAGVGGRFHDDFQGLENWTGAMDVLDELQSAGIAPEFRHVGIREQVCFDSYGRRFTFRSGRPFYYLVRRGSAPGSLDCALRDQALRAGVEIRFRDNVEHLPEGVVVARGPRQSEVIAVGYVFSTGSPDGCYGVLDDRFAPRGYAYLLIQGGQGTLATCMFADFHNERTYLARTTAFFQEKLGIEISKPRRFGGIGTFTCAHVPGSASMLLAGEAAGLQDALWGFGMRYAMRSGVLAARRLARADDARTIERDETRLQDLYRAGRVNRLIYARLGNPGYSVFLRMLARASDPRAWLGRRYAPSVVKSLLAPLTGVPRRLRDAPAREKEGCDCTWCRRHRGARPGADGLSGGIVPGGRVS
jgi:flavin-dependent dehydrogenase